MNSTIAPIDDQIEPAVPADADAPESQEAPAPRTPRQLVKLTIDVTEAEFDRDIDDAFRKIGREARLPGFRAGKAPPGRRRCATHCRSTSPRPSVSTTST